MFSSAKACSNLPMSSDPPSTYGFDWEGCFFDLLKEESLCGVTGGTGEDIGIDEFGLPVPGLEPMEIAVVSRYHRLVVLHFLADPDGIVVSELLPFYLFYKAVPRVLELRGGVRSLGALPEQLHDDFLVWIFVVAMCIGASALNTRFMCPRSALRGYMPHPKTVSRVYELRHPVFSLFQGIPSRRPRRGKPRFRKCER